MNTLTKKKVLLGEIKSHIEHIENSKNAISKYEKKKNEISKNENVRNKESNLEFYNKKIEVEEFTIEKQESYIIEKTKELVDSGLI